MDRAGRPSRNICSDSHALQLARIRAVLAPRLAGYFRLAPATEPVPSGRQLLLLWVWDWRFLSLLILSTALDYAIGRLIAGAHRRRDPAGAKRWLAASVVANLGILGVFKLQLERTARAGGQGYDHVDSIRPSSHGSQRYLRRYPCLEISPSTIALVPSGSAIPGRGGAGRSLALSLSRRPADRQTSEARRRDTRR